MYYYVLYLNKLNFFSGSLIVKKENYKTEMMVCHVLVLDLFNYIFLKSIGGFFLLRLNLCFTIFIYSFNLSSDVRKRLELIQDFEMPSVSNCVKVSPDEQFICATGEITKFLSACL